MKVNKEKKINNTNIKQKEILKNRINGFFLLMFLLLIIIAIILNFVGSSLSDFGYWDGKLHIGYYKEPGKIGNHPIYLNLYYSIPRNQWANYGLSPEDSIWIKWNIQLSRQPSIFWSLTQFTWITTFFVLLTIIFRYFKIEIKMPKKMQWLICHDTLFFIMLMDIVVMVVFWSVLLKSFNKGFNTVGIIKIIKLISTILVHAAIPISLIIYTTICEIFNKNIKSLNKQFIVYGSIVIFVYITYYILISFAWVDPYAPFTNLQKNKGWWELGVIIPSMEFVIIGGYYFHDFFISKFNKYNINKRRKKIQI